MTPSAQTALRLAHRTDAIAPFQVMELVKQATALQQQGHPVIHLSIGEPDFTAPPAVIEALERAARAGRAQYTPAVGTPELRAAIAEDTWRRHGVRIAPERVIVTAGASAALTLACCALVNPGDEVLLTDPSYPCNRHFVAAFDGLPVGVRVGAENRFQMTARSLIAHWSDRTVGTLLASPANPTGTSIPFDELARIVEAVRARSGFTIVDEIYIGLSHTEQRVRSALELGEDIIVCNSFSKVFQMTGWRLGWLVVPQQTVPVFEKLSQNLMICASALAQHAALACFEPETLAIYEERRRILTARRDAIAPKLSALGFGIPVMPDGAFYLWLDCSRFGDSSVVAHRLLHEAHVSVVPGHDFGQNDPERWLRLSYAAPIEVLEQALTRMAPVLAQMSS
ncbi:MAG: pyridoxal phosphate-dependent aminotransferase [Burkholderiales bacterium]|jgi:aspartate/methionine/tyrosine aminotransferase